MEFLETINLLGAPAGVVVAIIALSVTYRIFKRRKRFDSLVKMIEHFHFELAEDRDAIVNIKIKTQSELDEYLNKLKNDPEMTAIHRSIIKVLNFYALTAMMIKNKHLDKEVVGQYFGGAIRHKIEDWKELLDYLEKDENYKGMIAEVRYIYKSLSSLYQFQRSKCKGKVS